MDDAKPPGRDDPIVPLEYRSARVAAASKVSHHPIPLAAVANSPKSSATRLYWLIAAFALLGVSSYGLHWYNDPKRALALREECAQNLRTIATACIAYSDAHEGKYPPSFEEMLQSTGVTADIFVCPASSDSPAEGTTQEQANALYAGGHVSYIWLGKDLPSDSTPDTVLAYEPLANHRGAGIHVLFTDYRVEWLDEADAKKLIDSIVPGETTVWPLPAK